MVTKEKKARKFHRTDCTKLRELMAMLKGEGVTLASISAMLGYSDNAASTWLENNEMPYVAGLACELMLLRGSKGNGARPLVGIVLEGTKVIATGRADRTHMLGHPLFVIDPGLRVNGEG